jgi:hypothetical protein
MLHPELLVTHPDSALARLERLLMTIQPDETAGVERGFIERGQYRQFAAAFTIISTGRQSVSQALRRVNEIRLAFIELGDSGRNAASAIWCYKVEARQAVPNVVLNFTLTGLMVKIHSSAPGFAVREIALADLSTDDVVEAFTDFIELVFKARR